MTYQMGRLDGLMHGIAIVAMLVIGRGAIADDPVTWSFDEETEGEDILWSSPTSVDPNADLYRGSWELTGVWVTVDLFGQPVVFEVTEEIPPEYRLGTELVGGPAPIVLFDDRVVAPEPPEDPAIEADIEIGLDESGFGYVNARNIVLGTFDTGIFVVDIIALRVAGTVTIKADPADINNDDVVDVTDLLLLLGAWGTDDADADIDGNGIVDVADLLLLLSAWD
jgi:hypothetical protein